MDSIRCIVFAGSINVVLALLFVTVDVDAMTLLSRHREGGRHIVKEVCKTYRFFCPFPSPVTVTLKAHQI